MRSGRRALGALCGGVLIAGAAGSAGVAADRPPGDPPPPGSLAEDDLEAWSDAYVQPGAFLKAAVSQTGVLLYDPRKVELSGDGVRAVVRVENYSPQRFAQGVVRSSRDSWDIDCKGRRVRKAAMQAYPQSNLQGRATTVDVSKQDWTEPYAPNAPVGNLIEQACSIGSILRSGVDLAKAMPPDSLDTTEPGTRAWIVKYVMPDKYTGLWFEYGVGVFYDKTTAAKSESGRPLVWVRSEFSVILPTAHTAWRSMLEQSEIDCPLRRSRTVKRQVFPGSNLTGAAYADPEVDAGWTEAQAGAMSAKWLRSLCSEFEHPTAVAEMKGELPVPPPGGAQAWAKTYVNGNGYTAMSTSETEVVLYAMDDLEQKPDGHVVATVRHELTRPLPVGKTSMRSYTERVEFDCRGRRSRALSIKVYPWSNLEPHGYEDAGGEWSKLAPGTNGEYMLDQFCSQSSLLGDDVDRDKAMPPPLWIATDAARQQWIDDHIDFGEYSFSGYSDAAAALYSNAELERTREDFIRVWVRLELFEPETEDAYVTRSLRTLMEFDCRQQRSRTLGVESFPGSNLTGEKRAETRGEAEWSFTAPRSLYSLVADDLCSIKDSVDADEADPAKALPTSSIVKAL